eukprot:4995243-Ditylum_brightwellii.AAC.1
MSSSHHRQYWHEPPLLTSPPTTRHYTQRKNIPQKLDFLQNPNILLEDKQTAKSVSQESQQQERIISQGHQLWKQTQAVALSKDATQQDASRYCQWKATCHRAYKQKRSEKLVKQTQGNEAKHLRVHPLKSHLSKVFQTKAT